MMISAPILFQQLVSSKLAGRCPDVIGFVDDLLAMTRDCGEVSCRLTSDDRLSLASGAQLCEVELDAARGKLRMLCARLNALCQETPSQSLSPYGGVGTILLASTAERWHLEFKNTPGEHEFHLAYDVRA